ncbi:ATPase [Methylobacterium sp. A49B]
MSEPARSTQPIDAGDRPAPGPLRDWLAAMKTQSPAEVRGEGRSEERRSEKVARTGEATWSPRIVDPAQPSSAAGEDADLSELMAENLMLKAKLRLEAERQDELQAILAEEIRSLREHIREEIGSLEDLRAEQEDVRAAREDLQLERERVRAEAEAMRAERDRATAERDALRAETLSLTGERDALREERDLWRARTEALAQPLFQMQKR